MTSRRRILLETVLCMTMVLTFASPAGAVPDIPKYTYIDLGPVGRTSADVNETGDVVGYTHVRPTQPANAGHAVLTAPTRGFLLIPHPGTS